MLRNSHVLSVSSTALFQWAPTLGSECYASAVRSASPPSRSGFNGHPPLGVNATPALPTAARHIVHCFNRHPPLGVNATTGKCSAHLLMEELFQSAPTLGGECYRRNSRERRRVDGMQFQWAPTLGGECYYIRRVSRLCVVWLRIRFNGHPPLRVNATLQAWARAVAEAELFQWAPTLGGECYATGSSIGALGTVCFNGHPPLGVNATGRRRC